MIDHLGISVLDYAASKRFYQAALAPLGVALVLEVTPEQNPSGWASGFGRNGKPDFWISEGGQTDPGFHIAFLADSRAQVDAFHAAALTAGGTDNGQPGLRPIYHPNYYGAFVRDLNGFNVEAVFHGPD